MAAGVVKSIFTNIKMKKSRIIKIAPQAAIQGGEIYIECEDFAVRSGGDVRCLFDDQIGALTAVSSRRIISIVPELRRRSTEMTEIKLFSDGEYSENSYKMTTASKLADGLHIVANPLFDPNDNCLIVTRSGSRGQELPVTLFRLRLDGDLEDISGDVLNPTGLAIDPNGQIFVSSRAEGTVYRLTDEDDAASFAADLGIATGIAFDKRGNLYVGDRSGTIYKINSIGESQVFATLEQSIAAYHLAFGLDDALYVTRPNVASYDSIVKIDESGEVSTFYRGLGRPQGLAFDRNGNLYVAACLRERRGIVRITPDGEAEIFVSGMNVVGLCFGKNGEMFVATNDAIHTLNLDIYGILT